MKAMEMVPWPLRTLLALVMMGGYCLLAVTVSLVLVLALPVCALVSSRPWRTWLKLKSLAAHYSWAIIMYNFELGGMRMHWYGDEVPCRETAVVISNHRSFNDWMVVFTLAMRKGRLGCCKFFVKDSAKWLPGLGLGMMMMEMPFLKRDWTRDRDRIEGTFAHMKRQALPFWLVSFLEGTRFTPAKHKASEAWAKKADQAPLQHLLQARLRGFRATVSGLRDGTAPVLYDLTIAYDNMRPPPFLQCVAGAGNTGVHVHVRRTPLADLPQQQEQLDAWCRQRWLEKDQLLQHFVAHGSFPGPQRDWPRTLAPLNF